MANASPPSLPSQSSALLLLLLLLLLISSTADGVSSTTESQELHAMLEALRNHGYTLFTNAITTSDIQYQLLSTSAAAASNTSGKPYLTSPFTLFAPRDELLYALDMATDAAVYVSTLRYHVIPDRRHTFADLQNLSSPFLDTLLPHYAVLIGKFQDGGVSAAGVMVDGVRVSVPDLFLGSRIAVHGIDGILLTGLNMNQDSDGNDNGTGIFPPVESPATGLEGNIPAGGAHAPLSQFDWSVNGPPAHAEGTVTTPPSQFDRNNDPVAPASTFSGNIPAKGAHSTPTPQFDWNTDPGDVDGNIPAAAATPKILQDQMEKLKSLGKKKRGKHHRKGRRHHRRHRAVGDHRLGDL